MAKYVAFLRGINLGGRTVKMEPLRKAFEEWGYEDVTTILASGNLVFETAKKDLKGLRAEIEAGLKRVFGFDVRVILRSEKQIKDLIKENPFKGVKLTPKTRLFITFLTEPPKAKTAFGSAGKNGIYAVAKDHVVSVLGAKDATPDHMTLLKKEFGTNITTRNWNTILKVARALE